MRLQLVCEVVSAALVLLVFARQSAADDADSNTETRLRIYADSDHVTVVSPSVSSRFGLGDSLDVDVATSIDAVTAASVDVITSASPSTVHELRVEGSSTAIWSLSSTMRVRAGGVISHESDYDAYRPSVGGQIEVAERNATIDVSYTAAFDEVGHAVDSTFERSRRGHIAAASVTQILDARTYLDVLVDVRHMRGYHASPYRQVPIRDAATPALEVVDERTPSLRRSGAAQVRLRRALGGRDDWFVHGSYRLYGDSWRVMSHTLNAQVLHAIGDDRFLLGLHLRGYHQGAAEFYRAYYEGLGDGGVPEFRTRDRTLGGMQSLHASLTCDAALSKKRVANPWRLRGMLAATEFLFTDYPAQRERRALTVGITLHAPI